MEEKMIENYNKMVLALKMIGEELKWEQIQEMHENREEDMFIELSERYRWIRYKAMETLYSVSAVSLCDAEIIPEFQRDNRLFKPAGDLKEILEMISLPVLICQCNWDKKTTFETLCFCYGKCLGIGSEYLRTEFIRSEVK